MICGFGEPENIPELWEKHKQSLSEDLIRKYSEETGPLYALAEINLLLQAYGLSLEKLKLPSVGMLPLSLNSESFDV
jgi:hypothetical protein